MVSICFFQGKFSLAPSEISPVTSYPTLYRDGKLGSLCFSYNVKPFFLIISPNPLVFDAIPHYLVSTFKAKINVICLEIEYVGFH